MNRCFLKNLAIAFVIFGMIGIPSFAQTLQCQISNPGSDTRDLSMEGAWVDVTLTNKTDSPLYILKYQTPIEGIENNLFAVELDGEKVPYMGRMVLRAGPVKEDWVRIDVGETRLTSVDLSKIYDMRRSGTYLIRYQAQLNVISVESETDLPHINMDEIEDFDDLDFSFPSDAITIESNDASMAIDSSNYKPVFESETASRGWCSSSQLNALGYAQSLARGQASSAYSAVGNNNWFVTWFGYYSYQRANYVQNGYGKIYNALNRNIRYNCGGPHCTGSTIAYVYKGQPYETWICSGFWGYGNAQRGSIVLHEVSHWYITVGTEDYVYGYSNCQWLARNRPDQAINNADSYAYGGLY